jgi:alanine racemase
MIRLLSILKRTSYPLNVIELNKKTFMENYKYLSTIHQNLKVAPVLKSNAYGHGLKEIGKMVDRLEPPFICVDSLYEANLLQKEGVKSQILIMGYVDPRSLERKKMPFSYAVFDLEQIETINKNQKGAKIHIFIDTGMHREGVPLEGLETFLEQIHLYKNIQIEGIMSHLAATDKGHEKLWQLQINNFKKALELIQKNGIYPKWVHLGSSGVLLHEAIREQVAECSNVVRAGRVIYGLTLARKTKLKPVLTLKSKIYQIKEINKGDFVGYDGTFVADRDMLIATLPLGYFDGIDRRLSNTGVVTVNDTICPIVGRVSMNITTIDVSEVKDAQVGMEALVISDDTDAPNSIENLAIAADTIPHELLVHLVSSTRREVI